MHLLLTLAACGLKDLLPGNAVLSDRQLADFESIRPSNAAYTSAPIVAFPVLALQPFGLQYAVDVVMVSDHPDWTMHEYARLDTPQGSFWIAKDSDPTGRQTIVADIPNLDQWLPEIPAPRFERYLSVTDQSSGNQIDVCFAYTNPNNEPVEACARGTMPNKPPPKRNGNTMGHSRDVVAAVLDIDRFLLFNTEGHISIGGSKTRVDKVLGIVPFRSLLRQTQAGLATANFRLTHTGPAGFSLTRPSPARPEWPTSGTEEWSVDAAGVHHDNGIVAFHHELVDGELTRMTVRQHGMDNQTFEIKFQPALPDLRRRFEGAVRSQFVMNVNGQVGHGTGQVTAEWSTDQRVRVRFIPTSPRWLVDRPMETKVHYNSDGTVDVFIDRVPPS